MFEDSARVCAHPSDIIISVLPAGTCGLRLMPRCDAPINCTGSHKGVNTARLISESDRIPRLQQPLRRRISGDETKVRRRAALPITDQRGKQYKETTLLRPACSALPACVRSNYSRLRGATLRLAYHTYSVSVILS